ncbi:MAG: hypothetical protein HY360_19175 [Verrucomicrobia bacterium]|nr:hypothetical protein [Verrucomicrobiota bacterium]
MNVTSSSNDLLTYDYSRSFVQWWTDTVNHSPRCALQASCRLRGKDGSTREFFLTHPCAGEKMYADRDIIHIPTADFHMIFAPGEEFMIVKIFSEAPTEFRTAHRVGEKVPTHDGRGCVIGRMEAFLRRFPKVRQMRSDDDVYAAMTANLPILARTRFICNDGKMEAFCEYPVTVMNARHDDHRWQVDTGPILIPDFSLKSHLPVGLFRQAYIVYNSWDWAEIAMRRPVEKTPGGPAVMHYTSPRRLTVQNQLFCADI